MSDAIQTAILAAFSAALERAISQAVATHVEDLQARLDALADRIDTAGGLADRMTKLEREAAEAATAVGSVLGAELRVVKTRLAELEETETRVWTKDQVREIAEAAAEQAIDAHCSDYDHDSYDSAVSAVGDVDFDDLVTKDDVGEAVREALDGQSFTISL